MWYIINEHLTKMEKNNRFTISLKLKPLRMTNELYVGDGITGSAKHADYGSFEDT